MRNRGIVAAFVILVLCGLSPLAAAPVIERGIDVFTTTANGKTFYDFGANPIPAGFFCKRSAAFTGRVALKGLPLEADGDLRGADTVIERLDDAAFDENGVARTRVRFRALSLGSIAPLKTSCGAFHLYITLDGPQRDTGMRIFRANELGGTFHAPLSATVRMTFVPVKGRSVRRLELKGSVLFPGHPIPWSHDGGPTAKRIVSAVVDTNGDLTPDTPLFGTSNFAPGWSPTGAVAKWGGSCSMCEPEICHDNDGEQHCTGPTYACYPYHCP
ncbi:MAG TPA: hypothetical protein VE685_01000 [Thermoanaerobaculia bacterium]|nr:hypothetical protein [Thermoanaerobaculia bacterium]